MKKLKLPTKPEAQVRLLNAITQHDRFKALHPEAILDRSLWPQWDTVSKEWIAAFDLAELAGLTQREQRQIMSIARGCVA